MKPNRVLLLVTTVFALSCSTRAQSHSKARAECDLLRRAVLTMAESALQSFGEFAPYGAGLNGLREVVPLVNTGIDAVSQRGDAVTALRNRLTDALRSGEVRASALVYEVKVLSPPSVFRTDAIGIVLQHRDGYSAVHVIPYSFNAGQVTFGEPEVIEQRPPRSGL